MAISPPPLRRNRLEAAASLLLTAAHREGARGVLAAALVAGVVVPPSRRGRVVDVADPERGARDPDCRAGGMLVGVRLGDRWRRWTPPGGDRRRVGVDGGPP